MNLLERQFFPQRGLNKYLGPGSMADEYIQGGGLFGALMNYSPHLAEAKNRLLPQAQTAAEYIGPAADMQDMKHYSGATMDEFMAGNYAPALANLGMTGAAMVMTALPGSVGAVDDVVKAAKKADDLPMDTASRMKRAEEMGFDTDVPIYHGTRAENIDQFRNDLIGSSTDAGHYGRGHYFASTPGEAGYYGPNVGKYFTNARLLDLDNTTGDLTYSGHFKSFAPKLDAIGALDETNKRALKAYQNADQYIDGNVKYIKGVSHDGTEGWIAKVKNPAQGYTDEISTGSSLRGEFPKTKEEALDRLRHKFYSEMSTFHPDQFPGLGEETASLSDYIRVDSTIGAQGLTDLAKKAGYGGVKYGDETVVFDPKNIRNEKAKFDPAKKDSADLLASIGGVGLLGALGLSQSDEFNERY